MNLLPNNLTFAVLVTDGGWRTDLTIRFCEYFSHRLNDEDFITKIIFPESVDEALKLCTTDYLLIQSGGNIPFSKFFFEALDRNAEENEDAVLGNIVLANDYATLDKSCMFFNLPLWRELGSPGFIDNIKEGPVFDISSHGFDKFHPEQIKARDEERMFVPGVCAHAGSGILIRQMEKFGKATSLSGIVVSGNHHFLDTSSPYHEIHSETIFEKLFLKNANRGLYSEFDDVLGDSVAEVLVAPAQGLKAYTLAQHFKSSTVIVYDSNLMALEFQRMIFSVEEPTLYGDIVASFLEAYPGVMFLDDFTKEEYTTVLPLQNVDVDFREVDAFSFEMENLVKSIPHDLTAVFDFSDIYVAPTNYYRRPLYQVQGLFAEIYSLIKSRIAPSQILGFAPGYQNMQNIEINTSRVQYQMDPTFDPTEKEDEVVEIEQEETESVEEPEVIQPTIFAPPTSPAVAEQNTKWSPPLSAELIAPPPPPTPSGVATDAGYTKTVRVTTDNGVEKHVTVFTKHQEFEDDFTAIFEYSMDEIEGVWSFKVGKPNHEKQIEFSNGMTHESFYKHLAQPVKINPKTASKYFK